jgi:uncharacterized membrane protein
MAVEVVKKGKRKTADRTRSIRNLILIIVIVMISMLNIMRKVKSINTAVAVTTNILQIITVLLLMEETRRNIKRMMMVEF